MVGLDGSMDKGSLSFEEYDTVKKRMEMLKQQHLEIVEARRAAEKMDALTSLKFEDEKRNLEYTFQKQIQDLQKKLKDSLDRSSRARDFHEREKKSLLTKLNGLTAKLEEKHTKEIEEKDAEIVTLTKQLNNKDEVIKLIESNHAKERVQWQIDEQQCKDEIESLIKEDKSKLSAQMNQWKEKALSAEQLLAEAARKLKGALHEVRHKEKAILDLNQTIEFLNAEKEQLEDTQQDTIDGFMEKFKQEKLANSSEIEAIREEHALQLKEYSSKKSGDLEVLHSKFQDVILKKNATISHLKAELQEVNEKMKHLQSLIT